MNKSVAQQELELIEQEPKPVVSQNLETILNEAPAKLSYLEGVVSVMKQAEDELKDKLKVQEAEVRLRCKDKSKNRDILESYVLTDEEVIDLKRQLRDAEARTRAAEIMHRRAYDTFISARKIGGMQQAEWHALKGQNVMTTPIVDSAGNEVDPITGEIIRTRQQIEAERK
jgi:hypothetical protein